MKKILVDSINIISPLGKEVDDNFDQVLQGVSGVKEYSDPAISDSPAWVSKIVSPISDEIVLDNYSRYEQLLIASIKAAHKNSLVDITSKETLFVFSTTKGSISLLETENENPDITEGVNLFHSADLVTSYFANPNTPVVISNACTSGIVALIYAKRILDGGSYKNIVVAGADTISKFVYSGFQSFQALSPGPCHPFSENRNGINLGEAGATIILTAADENYTGNRIYLEAGSISNDSNHISGPSRTGAELSGVINKAIALSGLTAGDIDFVSAHGTATPYNDEMEAKALHLSGLESAPVNSLKGYFGHTLGAAGLVESVICIQSLLKNTAVASKGYEHPGVIPPLNIIQTPLYKNMKYCLKTASGFGGCNAAIIFSKN